MKNTDSTNSDRLCQQTALLQQRILDAVNFPILVSDQMKKIIYLNQAAFPFCKRKTDEILSIEDVFISLTGSKAICPFVFFKENRIYEFKEFSTIQLSQENLYSIFMIEDITKTQLLQSTLDAFTQNAPVGIFQIMINQDFNLLYSNDAFYRMYGYTKQEMEAAFDNKWIQYIHPDDQEYIHNLLFDAINKQESSKEFEMRIIKKDGSIGWIMIQGTFIKKQKEIMMCGYLFDITDRKHAEEKARIEFQYRAATAVNSLFAFEFDLDRDLVTQEFPGIYTKQVVQFNREGKCSYTQVLQRWSQLHIYQEDQQLFMDTFSIDALRRQFKKGTCELKLDYRCWDQNSQLIWVCGNVRMIELSSHGNICGFVYIKDIDSQKRYELELTQRARYDSLTGLYNRDTGQNLIEQYLRSPEDTNNAFLMIDIDNFKSINDTYGHWTGDSVLKRIGKNLSKIFRRNDIVCRFGGDEFCVLMKSIHSYSFLSEQKAPSICQALSTSLSEKDGVCRETTGSVGIVLFSSDHITFEQLYQKADLALYQAKALGKNQFYIETING